MKRLVFCAANFNIQFELTAIISIEQMGEDMVLVYLFTYHLKALALCLNILQLEQYCNPTCSLLPGIFELVTSPLLL